MKKSQFICLMLTAALVGVMLIACTDDKENGNDKSYAVTVLNYTDWEMTGNADFYDLTGKKVASEPIKSGKASAKLEDGTYFVQIANAPVEVSYNIVVLSSQRKRDTVKINDSLPPNENIEYFSFNGIVVVLKDNAPQSGLSVMVCYEPENGSGYCKLPITSDANGVAFIESVNAGNFHITLYGQDLTSDTIYDDFSEYSAAKRFIIVSM